MASYKAKAIILKTYKLGESDKIIKMYSQEGNIISAVAKGARKIRNRFRGRMELFNLVDLELSEGRNLDIINQVEIIKSFKDVPGDFYKFVFCEIISSIILKTQASGGESSRVIFKLIYICFNEINNQGTEDIVSLKKIMCFFGIKFLKITGYAPLLENCCRCSTKQEDLYSFHKDKIGFSVEQGGIICGDCSGSFPGKILLNALSYRFLYDLFNMKLEDLMDIEVNPQALKDIFRLTEDYLVYHTGCNPVSFRYLKKVGIQ